MQYTVDDYRYKNIESIGKNFVTLVIKFLYIDSIGITYKCTRKKLQYKSYKVFSYRFYRYPTTVQQQTVLHQCAQKWLSFETFIHSYGMLFSNTFTSECTSRASLVPPQGTFSHQPAMVGFNLYLSKLAFINQLYSTMKSLVRLSLANDQFMNHLTITSKYFDIVCYL